MPSEVLQQAEKRRRSAAALLDAQRRGDLGQYFTPAPVASMLASFFDLDRLPEEPRLLDPGAGTGSLTAAFIARVANECPGRRIGVTTFEVDEHLHGSLAATLQDCERLAPGIATSQRGGDFVEWACDRLGLLTDSTEEFDAIIMNPPYRKIHSDSRERALLRGVGIETTNLYTAFLALAVRLLSPGGQLVAITPRSFCNGSYFRTFRKDFTSRMALRRIHVFGSRSKAFKDAEVLQENVILHAVRDSDRSDVVISSSDGYADDLTTERIVPYHEVINPLDQEAFIHIVPDQLGTTISSRMARLRGSLTHLRLDVSTGRVVDFRARAHLRLEPSSETAPLVYPGHLSHGLVRWPEGAPRKPKAIVVNEATASLLVPRGNYVVVKRFTSKEEHRRVVAAIHDPELIDAPLVGFENHLNVFHAGGTGLPPEVSRGLAAFLNSTTVDLYFRLFNGHTQINATDLRNIRYPTAEQLRTLGRAIRDMAVDQTKLDDLVRRHVPELATEPEEVDPVAVHQRVTEALEVLRELGFPRQQLNERSALTLLALLDLDPQTRWRNASAPLRGITQMMQFFSEKYGKQYAPNTRETVRRQTVHQFVAAALVIPNPDKPERPVNSGQTVYQIEPAALDLIQAYGSRAWPKKLAAYRSKVASLRERWEAEREMKRIPVTLPSGEKVTLSPGGQNVLIVEVIDGFCSRFTPGGRILYVGDADEKFAVYERESLQGLGVSIDEHGKMPDLVVHDPGRNWLVLIEAVTSHGPMSPKRREELRDLFSEATADLVYVTAFLDRKTLAKFIDEISWETEVWLAENPSHLIHFDGERYLGPYPEE